MTYMVAGMFRADDVDEAKKIAEDIFAKYGCIVSIETVKPPPTEHELNEAWGV